jgi:hypothetical protein
MLQIILLLLGVICVGLVLFYVNKMSRVSLEKDTQELNSLNKAFEENERLIPEDAELKRLGVLSRRKILNEK